MSTLEQILAKSRQIEEKHKQFMKKKQQRDRSMKQTDQKAQKALENLQSTKNTLKSIDEIYERFQKSYAEVIDKALQKLQASKLIEVGDPDFQPDRKSPAEVIEILEKNKKVVILTGAGVSAASGIPTFRGHNGYWVKKDQEGISPEQFLTLSNFRQNQFEVWDWLDNFYSTKMKCKPNIGHNSINEICKKLKKDGKQVCLITQNIDNYHVQVQHQNKKDQKKDLYSILEIHGNILKIRCDKCSENERKLITYPYEDWRKQIISKKKPICPKCQSFLRPHIMFFDEFYTQLYQKADTIYQFLGESDLCIVIGTALKTGMARNIVQSFLTKSLPVIEINLECQIRQKQTIWMEGKSEELLSEMAKMFC